MLGECDKLCYKSIPETTMIYQCFIFERKWKNKIQIIESLSKKDFQEPKL